MNFDRRLGNQDVDAAALFAAARSFRPSARGRRRTLRALGLPVGLSLFGSGLAHAAYVLSSSLKGWGIVAGVVATVGAAGGVTYVATTAPSAPAATVSKQRPRRSLPATATAMVKVHQPHDFGSGPDTSATDTAPSVAAPSVAAVDHPPPRPVRAAVPRPAPVAVRHLAMPAEPRALPSNPLAEEGGEGGPPPAVPTMPERAERPVEPMAPPPFRAPPPAPVRATMSSSSSSLLNGELALVAQAQARLRVDDALGAFAALDHHVRLYPNGALAEEVQLLRVRAFIAKGDARAARTTGEAFLQRHPGSPLVARFRSLIKALDVPASP